MRVASAAPAVLALALGAMPASAATLLVPATYPTIQEAVDAAASGDLIKVAKGTFAPFTVFDKRNLTRLSIRYAAERGIDVENSTFVTVRRCRISNVYAALRAHGSAGVVIEKNVINAAGDEGIAMDASECVLRRNRVKKAADNGIEVGASFVVATDNTFERNTVIGSIRSGFVVADGGNTFRKNRAARSGVFDLVDTAGAGANVYEKNKFGTEQTP